MSFTKFDIKLKNSSSKGNGFKNKCRKIGEMQSNQTKNINQNPPPS